MGRLWNLNKKSEFTVALTFWAFNVARRLKFLVYCKQLAFVLENFLYAIFTANFEMVLSVATFSTLLSFNWVAGI